MGTNYYLNTDYCPCCGQSKQRLHIGKSSAGWRFNFDGAELGTTNFKYGDSIDRIREKLKHGNIENEYGEQLSYDDFFAIVEKKQTEKPRDTNDKYTIIVDGYEISNTTFS